MPARGYFDSRGIARVYAMDFRDGVWTLLRKTPDFTPLEFAQRFIGTFSADGRRIDGRWEQSKDGSDWALDFHLSHTRPSDQGRCGGITAGARVRPGAGR